MTPTRPFDAVLVVSFGGPQGPDDIRPFLANVLRGRRVPPERVEEVAHHYELAGGRSPITELTHRQAAGLQARLDASGRSLRVYVGMRNWHPFLADTLASMAGAGVRRAIGFVAAPHRCYSSCTQYRENVVDARRELRTRGFPDVSITYVGDWHEHEGFVAANADNAAQAMERLPPDLRSHARLVFTAHSIPTQMAGGETYRRQIQESARRVAERLGRSDWAVAYQSRSGRPQDPWLEPDVGDYLRVAHREGLSAAVIVPIGFVCDHIEVLHDLGHAAGAVCRELGLPMARAHAVNDHPAFLDMMADVVSETYNRYATGQPLEILSAELHARWVGAA